MRISYDKASRGLFIWFGDTGSYESEEVSPGIVVDYDRGGKPIGIEIEDVAGVIDMKALERLLRPKIRRGGDLAKFRAAIGLSQQQLADALDLPRNTLARWERDEMAIEKPRMLELALAALVTGVAVRVAKPAATK